MPRALAGIVKGAVLLTLLAAAWPLPARAAGAQYVYDSTGRLIQVIAPDGSSAQYTYDAAGNLLGVAPLSVSIAAVTGYSSTIGAVGSTITIYGSGFSTTTANDLVYFNGVLATVITATANSLTVIVPSGATTGSVTVTSSNGTASSVGNFVVSPLLLGPTITSVTPMLGGGGTAVTIAGSNFQVNSVRDNVSLSGFSSTVSSATSSNLGISIPAGSSSGKIAVTTPYGTAVSASDFFVPPPGKSVSDIGTTGRLAVDGPQATFTIGTGGKIGLILFDGVTGQRVSIQPSGQTFASWCGNAYINVYKPGNASIGLTNFCTGATAFSLPVTGTYTLVLAPTVTDTGSITLRVQNAPTITASVSVDGTPATVTTTVPAQQAQVTFTTTSANQSVSLQVSGSTFPGYCANQRLNLTGPVPATTLLGSTTVCTAAVLLTPTQLAAAGTYTLTLVPNGMDVGSVTIKLQSAPTVTASATVDGTPVTVTTTVPAQQAQFTFTTASANQSVSLQVSGSTFPGYCGNQRLNLTGPAPATTLLGSTTVCTAAVLLTPTQLAAAGTYTLTLVPNNMDVGSVTIKLQSAPTVTASASIGGPSVTVTTTVPAQQAQITFSSTIANQVISVQRSGSTYPSYCGNESLQLRGPAPGTSYIGATNLCSGSQSVTLGTIGTYTLTLIPYNMDTGSTTIQLQ